MNIKSKTLAAALLMVALAAAVAVPADAADGNEAKIDEKEYATLEEALNAAKENDTITLLTDVEVDAMVDLKTAGLTLDLGGHAITSSDSFAGPNENDRMLLQIWGDNITVKNGTLMATAINKHTLNIYGSSGFTVQDMVIDHSKSSNGAPVVVNGSTGVFAGDITLVTGEKSWYAMNVDNGETTHSNVKFADGSSLTFEGPQAQGISVEKSRDGTDTKVEFGNNVSVFTEIEGFNLVGPGKNGDGVTIENDDTVAVNPEPETPSTPGTGFPVIDDDDEDSVVGGTAGSEGKDDTVTIVACAAAAVVAALLAAFLILDRRP